MCNDHYWKYYRYKNSCKVCSSRLLQRSKRKISADNLSYVLSYFKAHYPDELIPLRKDNNVCSKCYFLGRALSESSQSASTDTDLEALLKKHSTRKEIPVLDQCVIYAAKKFLKNEPVLLQFLTFMQQMLNLNLILKQMMTTIPKNAQDGCSHHQQNTFLITWHFIGFLAASLVLCCIGREVIYYHLFIT